MIPPSSYNSYGNPLYKQSSHLPPPMDPYNPYMSSNMNKPPPPPSNSKPKLYGIFSSDYFYCLGHPYPS